MEKTGLGLVLAGGGGKGAYQIGIWKALHEVELDKYITSIAGTSVGGLNAALFMQKDLKKAEEVWKYITNKKILTRKRDSKYKIDRLSIFERDGLEDIIDEYLDMRCFDNSEYNCWMTCLCMDKSVPSPHQTETVCTEPFGTKSTQILTDGKVRYFNLKHFNDDERKKILLGTSAIPLLFPSEEILGQKYIDGGIRFLHGDNVPVKPLYQVDHCDLILIVHLDNMNEPVNRDEFPGAALFELFPKGELGFTLDFTSHGARKKIESGYNDYSDLFRYIREEIIDHSQERLRKWAYEHDERQQRFVEKERGKERILEGMNKYQYLEERDKLWDQAQR